MNEIINQKIDALLDAFESEIENIAVVIKALEDDNREVRQSALLLLSESNLDVAKEAIYNHLLFSKMTCLHNISNEENNIPDYLAIADYDNTIFGHWDVDYKCSYLFIWNLLTGTLKKKLQLTSHDFGIGKQGKISVYVFQDLVRILDNNTFDELI